jgi:transposase-like protein
MKPRRGRETFKMRNRIERWFGILKAKLKTFYNNFPYRSTLDSMAKFLESFIAIYNWMLLKGLS